MNNSEKIVALSKMWHEYVTMDHHKDRDCHWYIHINYAYGNEPLYKAWHSGYICDETLESDNYATLEGAQNALIGLIRIAMRLELEWCGDVLRDPEEYDAEQVKKAGFAMEKFTEALTW